MKGCNMMNNKMTWDDVRRRISEWLKTHEPLSKIAQAEEESLLKHIDAMNTVKYKQLTSLKKDRYLLTFAQEAWEIQSIVVGEKMLLIKWVKSFQHRGWKVNINPNTSVVSIDEYELI
jgi:hypothetical protein